jgi:hypothetical protein
MTYLNPVHKTTQTSQYFGANAQTSNGNLGSFDWLPLMRFDCLRYVYNDRFQSLPDYLVEEAEYRWLFCMFPFPRRESRPPAPCYTISCGIRKTALLPSVFNFITSSVFQYSGFSSSVRPHTLTCSEFLTVITEC